MREKLFNKTWKKFLIINTVYLLLCSYPVAKIFKVEYDYIKGGFSESYSMVSFSYLAPFIMLILAFSILICLNVLIIFDYCDKKGMIKHSENQAKIKVTLFEKIMLITLILAVFGIIQFNIVTIRDSYIQNITALQKDILINKIGVDNIDSNFISTDYLLNDNAIQERMRNKIVNYHRFKGADTPADVFNYIVDAKAKVDNMNSKINKLYYTILGLFGVLVVCIVYESTLEEKRRRSIKSEVKEEVI